MRCAVYGPWAASILENLDLEAAMFSLYTVSQRTCVEVCSSGLWSTFHSAFFATVNRHTERSERAEAGSLAAWLADHSRVAGVIKSKRVRYGKVTQPIIRIRFASRYTIGTRDMIPHDATHHATRSSE